MREMEEVVWKRDNSMDGYRIRLPKANDIEIRLNCGEIATVLNAYGELHETRPMGLLLWTAEIFRPELDSSHIELILRPLLSFFMSNFIPPMNLSVRFNRKVDAVEITRLGLTPETKRFRDVARVEIGLGTIRVEGEEVPDTEIARMKQELSSERAARQEAQAELSRIQAELATAQQALSSERAARQEAQTEFSRTKDALGKARADWLCESAAHEEAQQELSSERAARQEAQAELSRTKAALDNAQTEVSRTKAALDNAQEELWWTKDALSTMEKEFFQTKDALTAARADLSRERAAHKKTQGALSSEQAALAATREALSGKTAETEELKQELEKSAAMLELKTLDCEQARQTLDSLRERGLSDEDTLELMRAEPFLKGNSVGKTLETVERELDAAETRMGRIIRLREKINGAVQRAILAGDGTLPLSEDLGGNRNGGNRRTPQPGSEDGTGFERGYKPSGAPAAGN